MATILLIDDSPDYSGFLGEALRRAGHEVQAVSNGRQGLRALNVGGIDLVITDIFMPEADGVEMARAVRRLCPYIPVVVVTGGYKGLEGPVIQCMRALGAAAVFEKPGSTDELVGTVNQLLAQAKLRDAHSISA